MGEKISPDIIFFQYFNNIGILLCGCLAEAKGCLCAAVAQALLWGGDTGPPGDPLQTLGPFVSASTRPWMDERGPG